MTDTPRTLSTFTEEVLRDERFCDTCGTILVFGIFHHGQSGVSDHIAVYRGETGAYHPAKHEADPAPLTALRGALRTLIEAVNAISPCPFCRMTAASGGHEWACPVVAAREALAATPQDEP